MKTSEDLVGSYGFTIYNEVERLAGIYRHIEEDKIQFLLDYCNIKGVEIRHIGDDEIDFVQLVKDKVNDKKAAKMIIKSYRIIEEWNERQMDVYNVVAEAVAVSFKKKVKKPDQKISENSC